LENKIDYEELVRKLAEAEEIIEALRNQEVDAIVGKKNILMVSLKETEDLLKKQRDNLEALVKERDELVEDLKIHQIELENQGDELRRAHQKAQESSEKYLDLFDRAPVGYLTLEKDSTILEANLTAVRLLGVERKGLVHSRFTQFITSDDQDRFYFHLNQTLKASTIQRSEIRARRKDESVFYAQLESTAVHSEGKPDRIHTTLSDITDRKQAEEKLKESKNQYDSLAENIPSVLMRYDGNFRVVYLSPLSEIITGIPVKDCIGKNNKELGHPEHLCRIWENAIHEVFQTGQNRSLEFDFQSQQGLKTFYLKLAPEFDSNGKVAYVLGISTDITDRKKTEEALVRYKDELEVRVKERTEQLQEAYDEIRHSEKALKEANKQLKQYGYRITQVQEEERKRIAFELHDDTAQYLGILKMQLNALTQSEKIQSPEVREKLQYLEKDADRAFNDVRRYSHELRPSVLDHMGLRASIEQTAEDLNKLNQFKVEIEVKGREPELSEEVKLGFFRIAQEALNNVRKHAKAEKAIINLEFQKKQMILKIVDNGIGFDTKEARNRSSKKGSLGLLSMRERAGLIGASLKIESKPGQGTVVRVDLHL
jgi:PAS domain S-box-containing protein